MQDNGDYGIVSGSGSLFFSENKRKQIEGRAEEVAVMEGNGRKRKMMKGKIRVIWSFNLQQVRTAL